jgi:DNA-binding SARP family transcriptional activator/WD40 repeat protein
MPVALRVLGPIALLVDGVEVQLGPQLRRLVALLAVNEGRVVSSDAIADVLWPGEVTEAKAVRTYVARLRQSLGDDGARTIQTQAPGYRLQLDTADRFDARDFEAAAGAPADGDGVTRLAELDEALSWWSGKAIEEFADEPWAHLEAGRLEERRLHVVEDRYEHALDAGLHASSVADLERLVSEHPLRDRLTGQLMTALYRSGRQAEALRAFQQHREVMADAGLEAAPELRLLGERIARDDPLLGLETEPDRIRGYLRRERLGEGAFSTVWRAVQPTVDRDVAIKQVKAELANRPEFIRAFEHEAQVVAALEHPRVVPLYDYWGEVGAAYLVMRFLRGGTLADAIPRSGAEVAFAATVARNVGEALQAAHAQGVVHRDIKPANIFLDELGNAYLGDFGIAITGHADERGDILSYGSPAYSSPEQRREEPASTASDLFCFAVSLYETLTGELALDDAGHALAPLPPISALRPEIPEALSAVLTRATAAEPAERYASVSEFVQAFVDALEDRREPRPLTRATEIAAAVGSNPYRGLAAFDEVDAPHFFGRRRLVGDLVERLGTGRLVAVVGPSGSGKSSAVRAGLLPAVRQGEIAGSGDWYTATMVPGVSPFEELEVALSHLETETHPGLGEILRGDERGIARAVKLTLPDDDSDLLLVLDQFEELYTLCADADERALFAAALASAVSDPHSRLRVVVTIRADFWDRPLRDHALAALVESAAVHVVPMAPDELEAAIVEPARQAGCDFEEGLVATVSADVAGQPGALPLLQYTLTEIFEQREGTLLTSAAYAAMGGVSGAIWQRAEATFGALDDAAQTAARRTFGRLVTLGEGAEDTRRRVLRRDLGPDGATEAVLDAFGTARLLSFDRDDTSREPTVEIAHEALLREWPRLRSWRDDDRADLRLERHLERAAQDWEASGRPDSELYRGGRLESALEWSESHPVTPTDVEQRFLDASEERATAEQQRERTRVRRLRSLVTAIGVALVIAIVAGLIANDQRQKADDEQREAEAARADAELNATNAAAAQVEAEANAALAEANAADAEANAALAVQAQVETQEALGAAEVARSEADLGRLVAEGPRLAQSGEDPDLGMLIAAEAHARGGNVETLGALQRALVRNDGFLGHLVGEGGYRPNSLRFSGDLLVARSTTRLEVWDTVTRELVRDVGVGQGTDLAVGGGHAFTPGDGDLIDVDLAGTEPSRIASASSVTAVDVSTDGTMLLVGHEDGQIEVWTGPDWTDRRPIAATPVEVTHVALSPDTRIAAVAHSGGNILWFDVATATRLHPVSDADAASPGTEGFGNLTDLRWLDDTRLIGALGGFLVIDTLTGETPIEVPARFGWALAPLGEGRAIHGNDVYDVASGEVVATLDARDGRAQSAAVGPDGGVALATKRAISLFSGDGTQLLGRGVPRERANAGFVDADGGRVIALRWPFQDFTIRELDSGATTGPEFGYEPGTPVMGTYTANGGLMTYDWSTNESRFWDEESLAPLGPPIFGNWASLTISPDRRLAARGAPDGVVHVYDVGTGDRVTTLTELAPMGPNELRFSWGGSFLAGVSGRIGIWNTDDWTVAAVLEEPADGSDHQTLAFSRAGDLLATGDTSGRVTIYETATWSRSGEPIAGGPSDALPLFGTHGMRFSEDDRYLVLAGQSGAQMYSVADRVRIGGLWPNDLADLINMTPAPSGRQVVGATEDHLIVWDLEPETWFDIACRAAGRSLTEDEWAQFIGDEPYDPAC